MYRRFVRPFINSFERYLYGRIELQPIFESLHRIGLRGMGYMQTQFVEKTGEAFALKYALGQHSKTDSYFLFDVGANNGQFALLASSIFPDPFIIHSFEPSRTAFTALAESVANTGIQIHNYGLSNRQQTLKLFDPGNLTGSVYPMETDAQEYEKVELITLDAFCDKAQIHDIFYLKIDVEGAEMDVLQGAQQLISAWKVKFIQFEIGPNNLKSKVFFKEFFEILKGYSIHRIVKNGLREIVRYQDYLEIPLTSNFLAELKTE